MDPLSNYISEIHSSDSSLTDVSLLSSTSSGENKDEEVGSSYKEIEEQMRYVLELTRDMCRNLGKVKVDESFPESVDIAEPKGNCAEPSELLEAEAEAEEEEDKQKSKGTGVVKSDFPLDSDRENDCALPTESSQFALVDMSSSPKKYAICYPGCRDLESSRRRDDAERYFSPRSLASKTACSELAPFHPPLQNKERYSSATYRVCRKYTHNQFCPNCDGYTKWNSGILLSLSEDVENVKKNSDHDLSIRLLKYLSKVPICSHGSLKYTNDIGTLLKALTNCRKNIPTSSMVVNAIGIQSCGKTSYLNYLMELSGYEYTRDCKVIEEESAYQLVNVLESKQDVYFNSPLMVVMVCKPWTSDGKCSAFFKMCNETFNSKFSKKCCELAKLISYFWDMSKTYKYSSSKSDVLETMGSCQEKDVAKTRNEPDDDDDCKEDDSDYLEIRKELKYFMSLMDTKDFMLLLLTLSEVGTSSAGYSKEDRPEWLGYRGLLEGFSSIGAILDEFMHRCCCKMGKDCSGITKPPISSLPQKPCGAKETVKTLLKIGTRGDKMPFVGIVESSPSSSESSLVSTSSSWSYFPSHSSNFVSRIKESVVSTTRNSKFMKNQHAVPAYKVEILESLKNQSKCATYFIYAKDVIDHSADTRIKNAKDEYASLMYTSRWPDYRTRRLVYILYAAKRSNWGQEDSIAQNVGLLLTSYWKSFMLDANTVCLRDASLLKEIVTQMRKRPHCKVGLVSTFLDSCYYISENKNRRAPSCAKQMMVMADFEQVWELRDVCAHNQKTVLECITGKFSPENSQFYSCVLQDLRSMLQIELPGVMETMV